jgi:hypothetical protein
MLYSDITSKNLVAFSAPHWAARIAAFMEHRKATYDPKTLPVDPSPCEHLRSELLAEKQTAGVPLFQMRKCLDCGKAFRVRSSVEHTAEPK